MSEKFTRREFVRGGTAAALGAGALLDALCAPEADAASPLRMKEAMFYNTLGGNAVQCRICPKGCTVRSGERGFCRSRENRGGKYYTLIYGSAAAVNIDPVEKKPLFHFMPGARTFSFGTAGCNFHCKHCQNWELAQARPEDVHSRHLPPARIVSESRRLQCPIIAYTYTEPVAFYEYMHDTAMEGHKAGLRSVMISNGYINREPMTQLLRHLDAVKVDWKGITEEFYREYCEGTLQPVLNTMGRVKEVGKWLEVVYLVIPGVNDSPGHIRSMARWVKRHLGADTPVHFSRFMPHYQLRNLPPTPTATLERCHDVARAQELNFVYLGNLPGHRYESTYCPGCNGVVIRRWGFEVRENRLKDGKCPSCGREIAGVWT